MYRGAFCIEVSVVLRYPVHGDGRCIEVLVV